MRPAAAGGRGRQGTISAAAPLAARKRSRAGNGKCGKAGRRLSSAARLRGCPALPGASPRPTGKPPAHKKGERIATPVTSVTYFAMTRGRRAFSSRRSLSQAQWRQNNPASIGCRIFQCQCNAYFASLPSLFSLKWSRTSLMMTGLRARMAIRFGMAMKPLSASARFQASARDIVAPTMANRMKMTL